MTHAEAAKVRESYTHDERGVITQLGKFESEMIYVPYLWDASYENPAECVIDEDDRTLFPELGDTKTVYLYEDDQGFVTEIDKSEFDAIEDRYSDDPNA